VPKQRSSLGFGAVLHPIFDEMSTTTWVDPLVGAAI
jgi:hypothetical protein